ncbi:PLP-dependent transferase [Trichodelitschia bisporula]|uniref:serine C-palmitoyltransferase n=1 Tax=Trichodelitschia bisporula TaxID=703511 RepID=A0A6G1IA80_9PEZI|nr:PLP-dependent transferase [Trichodelitschia bisporula]
MDFQNLQDVQHQVLHYANVTTSQFQRLPGSAIALRYIKSSYQNDPVRSAIELVLVLFAVRYLLAPSYSTQKPNKIRLTEEEVDDLVEDWTPEPLALGLSTIEEAENEKRPVVVGPSGPKVKIATASGSRHVTNLASWSFYNFGNNEIIKEKAIASLRRYGVGPCGPPNFYGTQDVHMKTEAEIAAHIGAPACILYAQGFSTISSVIPAFSKRGDIIVADRAVNYPIRKGIQVSRSTVYWYDHNDMEDLKRVLETVVRSQAKKPLTRRFIVTEGLFENVGDMVNLPKLVEFKHQYKFRIILDETWSYGVLGTHGRGVTEQQNVDPNHIDMIIGSLAGPLCAGGGFCAGSLEVVEHQRISSSAYTFSAALPAMLATTASEALAMREQTPELGVRLRENIDALRDQFNPERYPKSVWLFPQSAPENPVVMLVLKPEVVESLGIGRDEEDRLMAEMVEECLKKDVLITRLKPIPQILGSTARDASWQPRPALKVCVSAVLSKKEIEAAGTVVRRATYGVMERRKRR